MQRGLTVVLDETHGRGDGAFRQWPADIYIYSGIAAEAGERAGLPRDIATLLAAQTTLGAAWWRSKPAIIRRCSRTP